MFLEKRQAFSPTATICYELTAYGHLSIIVEFVILNRAIQETFVSTIITSVIVSRVEIRDYVYPMRMVIPVTAHMVLPEYIVNTTH